MMADCADIVGKMGVGLQKLALWLCRAELS